MRGITVSIGRAEGTYILTLLHAAQSPTHIRNLKLSKAQTLCKTSNTLQTTRNNIRHSFQSTTPADLSPVKVRHCSKLGLHETTGSRLPTSKLAF
jgi:hypothetical protein